MNRRTSKLFKPKSTQLTQCRINMVLTYIVHCYLKMLADGTQYDFKLRGTVQQEDFLRDGLVNDYLSKRTNKEYYKNFISDNPAVDIVFSKEEGNTYNSTGVLRNDYIDISIYETKLADLWGSQTDDEIKFAVECKRIKANSDYDQYIGDIQKYSDRAFETYRLPFEGQIAFIEVETLTHIVVADQINRRLTKKKTINTTRPLNVAKIHPNYDGCYSSNHLRNYPPNHPFCISHLLFDYSKVVIN